MLEVLLDIVDEILANGATSLDPRDIIAQMLPLAAASLFAFGMCTGSFLNVCVWRLPRGMSLVNPPSCCPGCGHRIRWTENIPVISWLCLRARCRQCGEPISIRYPLIELVAGLGFLLVGVRVWTQQLPFSVVPGYLFLVAALIAVSLIDFEHFIIPNEITFAGIGVGVVLAFLLPKSHFFGTANFGVSHNEHLVLNAILAHLGSVAASVMGRPRIMSLLDAGLGLLVGFGVLWVIAEAGRRVWGHCTYRAREPLDVFITPEGVRVGADFDWDWEDLFFHRGDRLLAEISDVRVQWRSEPPPSGDAIAREGIRSLTVTEQGLAVDGRDVPWEEIETLTGQTKRWTAPREVMGYGDLKLLGMIGAFMGADACVFILMLATVTGSVFGIGSMAVLRRRNQSPVPFGPFIALGTFIWIFAGTELAMWYGQIMTRY